MQIAKMYMHCKQAMLTQASSIAETKISNMSRELESESSEGENDEKNNTDARVHNDAVGLCSINTIILLRGP